MKRYDFFTGGKNNVLVDKWMNMVNSKVGNEIEKLTDQHGQEHGTSEELIKPMTPPNTGRSIRWARSPWVHFSHFITKLKNSPS